MATWFYTQVLRKEKLSVILALLLRVKNDSEYSKSIQEFITLIINDPKALKLNKFG